VHEEHIGSTFSTAPLTNVPDPFRDEVARRAHKNAGSFFLGELARGAIYLSQMANALKYHNYYVCSVVTQAEGYNNRSVVAIGLFGFWIFGQDIRE